MQVQGAATEAGAAEVTRNESVNSTRFSGEREGWWGGGPGHQRPVFCLVPAAHRSASMFWDVGPPRAPTPRSVKDAGHPGFEGRSLETKQVPGPGAGLLFSVARPSVE